MLWLHDGMCWHLAPFAAQEPATLMYHGDMRGSIFVLTALGGLECHSVQELDYLEPGSLSLVKQPSLYA